MRVFLACMYVHHMHATPMETKRGHWILWN